MHYLAKITIASVLLTLITLAPIGKVADAQQASASSTVAQATVEAVSSSVTDVKASPASAEPASSTDSSTTPVTPSGYTPVTVGPLEMTPSSVKLNIVHGKSYGISGYTSFHTTVFLKIKNTSASDVKIIAFSESIEATDSFGMRLFKDHKITSSGILLSDKKSRYYLKTFYEDKDKFVTLSPNQIFESQLKSEGDTGRPSVYFEDKSMEKFTTYRPKSVSISGTVGIITIEGTNELRAFSFTDIPLTINTK